MEGMVSWLLVLVEITVPYCRPISVPLCLHTIPLIPSPRPSNCTSKLTVSPLAVYNVPPALFRSLGTKELCVCGNEQELNFAVL